MHEKEAEHKENIYKVDSKSIVLISFAIDTNDQQSNNWGASTNTEWMKNSPCNAYTHYQQKIAHNSYS